MKSGTVLLVGRPNSGKSTLLNNILGQKVAITSPKPQTTRFPIQAFYEDERGQIIFIDTPGIFGKAPDQLSSKTEKTYLPQYEFLKDEIKDFFEISSLKKQHIKPLVDKIFELLPAKKKNETLTKPIYPLINMDSSTFIAELIREKVFLMMGEEIPYTTNVVTDEIKEKEKLTYIKARILTTHDRYKAMLIGKKGRKIKEMGSYARKEIE